MDKNHNPAKVALANISQVNQELLQKKDPDKNMTNLNRGLEVLSSALSDQLGTINNLKHIRKDPGKEDAQENRPHLEGFIELMEGEILQLIEISKERIEVPKFEKKANDWTISNKDKDLWVVFEEKIKDELSDIKIKFDKNTNIADVFFKFLNIRDALLVQNMRGLIYKQCLMKEDINVPQPQYVHSEVNKILISMQEQKEKYGFIQSKYTFDKAAMKPEGPFLYLSIPKGAGKSGSKSHTSTEMFKLVANAFDELETLLRNIFGLTQVEKDAAIENSKEVTKSLRQQIEDAKYTIKSMEQKMQELNLRMKSSQKEKDEEKLKQKIEERDETIRNLEKEIKALDKNLMASEKSNQLLRNQLVKQFYEAEENYKKLTSIYFPKLEEIKKQQEDVIAEVDKMKKGVEYFPAMFRAEKMDKTRVINKNKDLEEKVEKLAIVAGQLRNQVRELKQEIKQKELINLELTEIIDEYKRKLTVIPSNYPSQLNSNDTPMGTATVNKDKESTVPYGDNRSIDNYVGSQGSIPNSSHLNSVDGVDGREDNKSEKVLLTDLSPGKQLKVDKESETGSVKTKSVQSRPSIVPSLKDSINKAKPGARRGSTSTNNQ